MKMNLVLCVMLVGGMGSLGGAAAHYRTYEERNLLDQDEIPALDGTSLVKCPVCEDSHPYLKNNEVCPIALHGMTYKRCYFGTYKNSKCGGRPDCYRGPNESCTENQFEDSYGQVCLPGYTCTNNKCTGIFGEVNSHDMQLLNSDNRYRAKSNQLERSSALNLNYPIRMRRQA